MADGWRGGYRHHGGGDAGAAIAGGLVGLAVGAAIASSDRPHYVYRERYYEPAPVVYEYPEYYAEPAPVYYRPYYRSYYPAPYYGGYYYGGRGYYGHGYYGHGWYRR